MDHVARFRGLGGAEVGFVLEAHPAVTGLRQSLHHPGVKGTGRHLLHPFAIGSGTPPPASNVGYYVVDWHELAAATLVPGGGSGYAASRSGQFTYGFVLPGPTTDSNRPGSIATAVWCYQDVVRGIVATGSRTGYTVDYSGDLHPYGPADVLMGCPIS